MKMLYTIGCRKPFIDMHCRWLKPRLVSLQQEMQTSSVLQIFWKNMSVLHKLHVLFYWAVFQKLAFIFLNRFLCCNHSLESPRRDDSNEWSQRRIRMRLKENSQKMVCTHGHQRQLPDDNVSRNCNCWQSKSASTVLLPVHDTWSSCFSLKGHRFSKG